MKISFKTFRNGSRSRSRHSGHKSRSSNRKSKTNRLGESMPESRRFREKTSEKILKKYNDSNFIQSEASKKRCDYPSDYYYKKSREYSASKKSRRSANKRRREYEEFRKSRVNKGNDSTRGGEPERAAHKPMKKKRQTDQYQKKTRSRSKTRGKSRNRTPKSRKNLKAEVMKKRVAKQEISSSRGPAGNSQRSKSQNFARHHDHCRCYICTCRRSNHQCPVSKGFGRPFLGNTINKTDFKKIPNKFYEDAVNPLGRKLNTPEDNLKFTGRFKPNTDYRDNYQEMPKGSKAKGSFRKDKNFHDFIRKKNNEDHIKNNLPNVKMLTKSQHRNYKHGDIDPIYYPMRKYRKSASAVRTSSPFMAKTVYQKDFEEWKNNPLDRKKPYKHQENLRAYNPEIPLAKFTEYNHANYIHMINKNHNPKYGNQELFKLFKERDKIPGGVIPRNQMGKPKQSEYHENFRKWKVQKNDCDLMYMPKVSNDLSLIHI